MKHYYIFTKIVLIIVALFSFNSYAQNDISDEIELVSGEGFSLKELTFTDDKGVSRTVELFYINSVKGVENAYTYGGLPLQEKLQLEAEISEEIDDDWLTRASANTLTDGDFPTDDIGRPLADSYDFWVIDKEAAAITTEAQALAYIQKMGIEQDVDEELTATFGKGVSGVAEIRSGAAAGLLGGCFGWKDKNKSFAKSLDKTYSFDKTFGNSSASLTAKGSLDVDSDINVDVGYKYKRSFCIPYKFRLRQMDAKADYDVRGTFNLTGKAQKNFGDQKWKIAEPRLVNSVFMVGPIPVLVNVKLPIEIGTGDIKLTATGEISLVKPLRFNGDFHYRCTTHSCAKLSAHHNNTNTSLTNSLGAAVSASVDLDPYIHVAARGNIYGDWFFYLQVGVKPSFPIHLYGYYGNLCGDGNADGTRETVYAGLGTVDFKVGITAESKIFGLTILRPKYWKLWQTGLLFKDFVSPYSTALSPVLAPSYNAAVSRTVSLPVSVRSCVKNQTTYHPRDYIVHWGDGTSTNVNDVKTSKTISHTYPGNQYYLIRVFESGGANSEVPIDLYIDDDW